MGLYGLFSSSVEIQYKSYLLSPATLFTFVTTLLNIIVPFIIAYQISGFWLKSYYFYEQPDVKFTYQYLLVANTDDPSLLVTCGDLPLQLPNHDDESCSQFQVIESDDNNDGINDSFDFKLQVSLSPKANVLALTLILQFDFQLRTICPLQMQSYVMIDKEFSYPSSGLVYHADIDFYQTVPLACYRNHLDIKYNHSIFDHAKLEGNALDNVMLAYFNRKVTTALKNINFRAQHGGMSTFEVSAHIRVPEQAVRYIPSFLQEMKWAWSQYLSLFIVFYFIFNRIKHYVFNKGLIMAWEVVPWKKH